MSSSVVVRRPVTHPSRVTAARPGVDGGTFDVFDELVEVTRLRRLAGVRELVLMVRAADEYEVVEADLFGGDATDAALFGGERWIPGGADGTPNVGEFLILELAGILGCSLKGASVRLANALNLRHRHPRLWDAVVHDHAVEAWQAVTVASDCAAAGLGHEACLALDEELAGAIGLLGWPRARRLLKGLIARVDPELAAHRAEERRQSRGVWTTSIIDGQVYVDARLDGGDGVALEAQVARIAELLAGDGDPRDKQQRRATALAMLAIPHVAAAYLEDHAVTSAAPMADTPAVRVPVQRIDPEKLRPRANLIVHLHVDDVPGVVGSGVARIEGHGPVDFGSLRHVLAGCHVTVRPMVDLNQPPVTDAYEAPNRLREHIIARNPVEVFPWSALPSRGCQLDHTVPYRPGAGRGQTRADNLGPLGITAHRAKTHGDWHLEQPEPGVFHWRSRAGFEYVVSPYGTIPLGRTADARKTPDLGGRQAGDRPPPNRARIERPPPTPALTTQPERPDPPPF